MNQNNKYKIYQIQILIEDEAKHRRAWKSDIFYVASTDEDSAVEVAFEEAEKLVPSDPEEDYLIHLDWVDEIEPDSKGGALGWKYIKENLIVPEERLDEWMDVIEYAMKKHSKNKNKNPSVADRGSVGTAAVKNAGKKGLW